VISRGCKELEGHFEEVDAEEIWLGGFVFEPPNQMGTERKRGSPNPDHSWPGYVNVVKGYPMFKKRL